MSSFGRIRAALFAGLACACSASPDVVATQHVTALQTDASPFNDLSPPAIKCQPGAYSGTFSTDSDAASIQLSGDFGFTLKQGLSAEFPTLADDAELRGTAQASIVTFNATIRGGSECIDGRFKSQIVDGKFYVGQGGTPVAFSGSVAGRYDITLKGFIGSWEIAVPGSTADAAPGLQLQGYWSASLAPKK